MTLEMVGRLDPCVLIAYRAPAERLRPLLPPGLELLAHGSWAFLGVVVSRVRRMRPRGLPRILGLSYGHVAYRLYARATLADGRCVDGIHFLRSDVDSRLMSLGGNLLTEFRFHAGTVQLASDAAGVALDVSSRDGGGDAHLRVSSGVADPAESCFASADEAARVLTYRPLGLACDGGVLKVAQVLRDEWRWRETPVHVEAARWAFLERLGVPFHLERATRVEPIDYRWRLGGREQLAAKRT